MDRYGRREFSPKEQRIVELVAGGLQNREIASELGTTEGVIKNHLRVIFDKAGVWTRLELALWHVHRAGSLGQ